MSFSSFLPETKGHSLEEIDAIFGATSSETREASIEIQKREIREITGYRPAGST